MKSNTFTIMLSMMIVCSNSLVFSQNILAKNRVKSLARLASESVAPFIAYVYIKRPPQTAARECLATIVSDNLVATSAFCVRDTKPEDVFVYPNQYNRTNLALSSRKYKVVQIIRKDYNRRSKANDIALLKLVKRITIDTEADIINLPDPIGWNKSESGLSTKVLAVGYDLYGEGAISRSLKETNLVLVNCRSGAATHICAATSNSDTDDDHHDISAQICGMAGTPILYNEDGSGHAWILLGILSFDSPDNCPSISNQSQTGFTEVAQYVNWIKEHFKQH